MIELITDRTIDDKKRADELQRKAWKDMTQAEKNDWISGLKGRYNYTDMNRVETATQQLKTLFEDCGYAIYIITKNDWHIRNIPQITELQRYIHNISYLRDVIPATATMPIAPTAFFPMDIDKANAIEQILININQLIENMIEGYFYLQDIYLGEA